MEYSAGILLVVARMESKICPSLQSEAEWSTHHFGIISLPLYLRRALPTSSGISSMTFLLNLLIRLVVTHCISPFPSILILSALENARQI